MPRPSATSHVVPRPPGSRAVLATVPMLAAVVALLVLVLTGVLAPVERVVHSASAVLWPDAPLQPHAILVELDPDAHAELGPPPLSPSAWRDIAVALDVAGFNEVYLVDPASRLVRPTPGPALPTAPGTTLTSLDPAGAVPPLVASDLRLPVPAGGTPLVGLGADSAGPDSAWCAWARCPTGTPQSTPLRPAEADALPRLRLSEILDGSVRTRPAPGTRVFLGLVDPAWAPTVPVGTSGHALSRTELAALGVSVLASRPPRPEVPLLLVVPLVALLVLTGALVAHLEPLLPAEAWVVVLPLAVVLACLGLTAVGLVQPPVVVLALAALAGALTEALRLRARMVRFTEALAARLARTEDLVGDDVEPTPEGVLQRLASLTWNHLPTDRMLYVQRLGARGEPVGGFGLSAAELELPTSAAALDALAGRPRADALDPAGRLALTLVPVPRGDETLGWWLVGWSPGELAPDRRRIRDLAAWAGEHATPRPVTDPSALLLRLDHQLDALEAAFARSARAGRRRRTLLRTADLPLAFVDRAGTVVFGNRAFERFFDAEPSAPRSLRELVFRVTGADGLSTRMRSVFEGGEHLTIPWPARNAVLHAAPSEDGARSGVLVWIELSAESAARREVA